MTVLIRKIILLLLGLGLYLNANLCVNAQSLEEQTVFAALTLNIVRFTTWPAYAQAHFNKTIDLCVIGDNMVQQSFTSIDHKTIGNKTLNIINLSRLRNFEECHVLYVSDMKLNVLLQVFLEIKKRPLLTIGEGDNFAEQGGMVGLENVDNKITLHVNLATVNGSGLKISARLLKLAKIIGN